MLSHVGGNHRTEQLSILKAHGLHVYPGTGLDLSASMCLLQLRLYFLYTVTPPLSHALPSPSPLTHHMKHRAGPLNTKH